MMDGKRTKKPERGGPLAVLRRFTGHLLSSRSFLRVFSVVVALTVWFFMMASDGTLTRRKTFTNAAVSVSGESTLLTRGYIVTDNLNAILPTVNMTVEVTQSNYDRANAASYNPHIELTHITGEGEFELPIIPTSQVYGQMVSCEPSTVTVHAERYVTRRVPVVITPYNSLPEGLYLVSAETDPATLVVSGPQSVVTGVTRVSVALDLSSLSQERMTDRLSMDFTLQNAAGETVTSDKLSVTNQSVVTRSVMVDVAMVPMKRVPIDTAALVSGEPAEGYELVEAWAAEDALDVAAEREILDAVTVIGIDSPLDITGADATMNGYVRLRQLTSLANRLPSQLGATAVIKERKMERTFRNVPILVEGLTDDFTATLSQSRTTIQITGGYAFIQSLTAENLQLYVDVTELTEGKYTLAVQVRVDNAEPFSCALSAPEITVQLRTR